MKSTQPCGTDIPFDCIDDFFFFIFVIVVEKCGDENKVCDLKPCTRNSLSKKQANTLQIRISWDQFIFEVTFQGAFSLARDLQAL
jgi:hypothetical protein